MQTVQSRTIFGSLDEFEKGSIEIVSGEARHYVFSNIFEVASSSSPYEKVAVAKNREYVIEAVRAEGESPWFTCSHDEFTISMDGEVRVDFIKLASPVTSGEGSVLAGAQPKGQTMGYIILGKGHQCLLPAGTAYRFTTRRPCALLLQTILGVLTVQKWKDICLQ